MLGANPEEMEGDAADDEGTEWMRRPRSQRATTVPAARSRGANGRTR